MRMKEVNENRRRARSVVRYGYKNVLKCSHEGSERLEHKITKFWVANFCWENGMDFWTEATLHGGGRADVVIADWNVVIEILFSEDLQRFKKKQYPMTSLPISAKWSGTIVLDILSEIQQTGPNSESLAYWRARLMNEVFK